MPAQKRPLSEGYEEEGEEAEPERSQVTPPAAYHYSSPSQLNGGNHPPLHLLSLPAPLPIERDAAWRPMEDDNEVVDGGGETRDDIDDEQHGANPDEAEADEEIPEEADTVVQAGKQEECDDGNGTEEWKQQQEQDSDATSSSDNEEKPEFVFVELADIRKEVQCPICLGIIKKTRTVMECLHRFCRECIDKSMRMGNNECPACRTHCASRRSLRDDPNYDALIAALYPDIDKYEEEELAFHEEERTRNKQIQASIAQIFQRQSEALARRRTMGKETLGGSFSIRPQRRPTRRRQSRGSDFVGSEDNDEENDERGGKDSSSADERSTEGRQRRRKKRQGARPSQASTSADHDGGSNENDMDACRDNRGVSPGLAWNTEMLAWGRGGARSHTRHGNLSGSNNKNSRSTRLSKLVDYIRNLEEKHEEQVSMHLKLISADPKGSHSLQQPYLMCRPSLSIKQLCEYVVLQTPWQAEEVEIYVVKGRRSHCDVSKQTLQILNHQETLGGIGATCHTTRGCLILAYRIPSA